MWQYNLTNIPGHPPIPPTQASLNAMAARTKIESAQLYHVTLFRPVCKTLLQAINKGHFAMWPNLTVELINHISPSVSNAKGHMKKIWKNVQSTKTPEPTPQEGALMDKLESHYNQFFSNITDTQQRIATDLICKSPFIYNQVNKYKSVIMLCHMKDRTDK